MKKLAGICPAPMTHEQRERAAAFVLRLADDPDAVAVVDRLDRFDAETLICRRGKPAKRKALSS